MEAAFTQESQGRRARRTCLPPVADQPAGEEGESATAARRRARRNQNPAADVEPSAEPSNGDGGAGGAEGGLSRRPLPRIRAAATAVLIANQRAAGGGDLLPPALRSRDSVLEQTPAAYDRDATLNNEAVDGVDPDEDDLMDAGSPLPQHPVHRHGHGRERRRRSRR